MEGIDLIMCFLGKLIIIGFFLILASCMGLILLAIASGFWDAIKNYFKK